MRSISALLTAGLLTAFPIILTETGSRPAVAQTVDARKAEADQLFQAAFSLWQRSQYPQALEKLQQALVIYREIGDQTGEGRTLTGIGAICDSLGQYPQALEQYQQALAIRREVDDRSGEGITLHNIGYLLETQK